MSALMLRLVALLTDGFKVLFVGRPGTGKTGRILAAARVAGFKVEILRASISDRIDFAGCLAPDVVAGITRSLPLDQLHRLQTTTDPTILFLDDLGQGQTDVQAAAMRLYDEGFLSPSVVIWAATNRVQDLAGVQRLCEPLRSRFDLAFAIAGPDDIDDPTGVTFLGTWKEELNGWIEHAQTKNWAPEIIAYHIVTEGARLYDWQPHVDPARRFADFRAWESVNRCLETGKGDLWHIGAAIGKPAASEFLAFCALGANLPSPNYIRMNPSGAPVPSPTDTSSLYLVTCNMIRAAQPNDIAPFLEYGDRLSKMFGGLLCNGLRNKLGTIVVESSREWAEWYRANESMFRTAA